MIVLYAVIKLIVSQFLPNLFKIVLSLINSKNRSNHLPRVSQRLYLNNNVFYLLYFLLSNVS